MKQGVAVIIVNSEGKILLQHRDEHAPHGKNTWSLWGGGKESDETSVEAAARELKEELAIVVDQHLFKPWKNVVLSRDGIQQIEVSVFELYDGGNFTYELCEGDDLRFFTRREASMLPLDYVTQIVFEDYSCCKDL